VYNVQVKPIALDLGRPDFMDDLTPHTADLDLGLLICNHMFTPKETPKFLDDDIETHLAMLDINARAYLRLVHFYGRQFVAQNRGGIIMVSSGAAFHGTAYTASYAANKAYQMILGESLWYELKDTAVDLLILTPGLTNTHPEGMAGYDPRMVMEVAPVVTETLENLGRKHMVVPGRLNKLTFFALDHLMSRRRAIETIGKSIMGQGLGKDE
ncbi:MAG: SDR family NAD(P)-dependent oxidoreductase, partial [Anaerolineales bacterium]|nr:SDR family NAD(P)-dependent oxidoreductase [Anaerolineales bacterium]